MDRIDSLRFIPEAESASFKEVSGLKFEHDVVDNMDWDLAYAPSPVENGNSIALEKITIAHEGFEIH
jgi:hypothetical protein